MNFKVTNSSVDIGLNSFVDFSGKKISTLEMPLFQQVESQSQHMTVSSFVFIFNFQLKPPIKVKCTNESCQAYFKEVEFGGIVKVD